MSVSPKLNEDRLSFITEQAAEETYVRSDNNS